MFLFEVQFKKHFSNFFAIRGIEIQWNTTIIGGYELHSIKATLININPSRPYISLFSPPISKRTAVNELIDPVIVTEERQIRKLWLIQFVGN